MKDPYSKFRSFPADLHWQLALAIARVLFRWQIHLISSTLFIAKNNLQIHPKTMMIGRLATRSAARAVARPAMASSFRAQAVRALASSTSPILSEAAAIPQDPAMFCRQCEQAREGVGCSTIGVCGKSPEASNAQDALVHFIKSVSSWCVAARDAGATAQDMAEANAWTLKAAFATLTNVNFSEVRHLYVEGYSIGQITLAWNMIRV